MYKNRKSGLIPATLLASAFGGELPAQSAEVTAESCRVVETTLLDRSNNMVDGPLFIAGDCDLERIRAENGMIFLESSAASAWLRLNRAAEEAGHDLSLLSTYQRASLTKDIDPRRLFSASASFYNGRTVTLSNDDSQTLAWLKNELSNFGWRVLNESSSILTLGFGDEALEAPHPIVEVSQETCYAVAITLFEDDETVTPLPYLAESCDLERFRYSGADLWLNTETESALKRIIEKADVAGVDLDIVETHTTARKTDDIEQRDLLSAVPNVYEGSTVTFNLGTESSSWLEQNLADSGWNLMKTLGGLQTWRFGAPLPEVQNLAPQVLPAPQEEVLDLAPISEVDLPILQENPVPLDYSLDLTVLQPAGLPDFDEDELPSLESGLLRSEGVLDDEGLVAQSLTPKERPSFTPEQIERFGRDTIRRKIEFLFGEDLQDENRSRNAVRIRDLRLDQIVRPGDNIDGNIVPQVIYVNQAELSWNTESNRWILALDPLRRGAIYVGDTIVMDEPEPLDLTATSLEDYQNPNKEAFLHTRYRQTFINQGARPSYLLRELEAGRHESLETLPPALMSAYEQIKPGVRVCLAQMIDGLPAQESALGLVTTGGGAGAITAWQWLPSTLRSMNRQLSLGLSQEELLLKIGDGRNVFSVALFSAFLGTLGEEIEQKSTQFFNTLNITDEARDCLQAQVIVNAYNAGGPIMNDMLAGLNQLIIADEGLRASLENLINEDPWLGYAALTRLAYESQLAANYGPQASQYTPKIAWLNQAMNEQYPLEDHQDLSGFNADDLLAGISEASLPRDQWLMAFDLVAQSETGRKALRTLVLDASGKVRSEIGNLAVFQIQHLYNGEPSILYVQKGRRITQAVWSEAEQTYVGADGKRIKLFTGNGVTTELPAGLEVSDPMLYAQELLKNRENYTIGVPGMELAQLVSLGDIPGVEEVIGFPVRNGLRRSETTLVHALAAENLLALATAYADEFGEPLRFNEIHRSIPYQISLGRSSSVAVALAASSLHNVGLAIDINGLARSPEQQQWFKENAELYGFEQEAGEAWHFEYKGVNGEVEAALGSSSYLRSNRAARNILVRRRMALARIMEQVVAPTSYLSLADVNSANTAILLGKIMAGNYENGRLVSNTQTLTEVYYVFDTTTQRPSFLGVIKASDMPNVAGRTIFDMENYEDPLTDINWRQQADSAPVVNNAFERNETDEYLELTHEGKTIRLFWPTSVETALYYEVNGDRESSAFTDGKNLQGVVLPSILNEVFGDNRPRLRSSLFTDLFIEKLENIAN